MESELLERIGLTRGESKVYLALIESGGSTAGRIAKNAGVSQSKIYEILERLCRMGLSSKSRHAGRMFFSPVEPKVLQQIIAEKKKELNEQEKALDSMLPSLVLMQQRNKPKHEAMVLEGYNAVKSYYYKTLDEAAGERLVFGARTGYPVSKSAQYFFRNYHRQRIRKGRKLRIIFNSDLRGSGFARDYGAMKLTMVRYLHQVTLSSVGIEGDSVDMLIWSKETVVLFVVKSREVASTFRGYFETLWKSAKQ